jgi:hypothetical protein
MGGWEQTEQMRQTKTDEDGTGVMIFFGCFFGIQHTHNLAPNQRSNFTTTATTATTTPFF